MLSQFSSPCILFFKAESITELGAQCFRLTTWPVSPQGPAASAQLVLELQASAAMPDFTWVLGTELRSCKHFVQQIFYPLSHFLSHLPSPEVKNILLLKYAKKKNIKVDMDVPRD